MKKMTPFVIGAMLLMFFPACTQHKVEVAPVEIKPIHITIDINIKIDKALDDFFGDIDETAETIEQQPSRSNKLKKTKLPYKGDQPMKNKAFSIIISMIMLGGLIANASAFAGADGIKERMKARLPVILSLKKQGIIGENNKGFLQFVTENKAEQDVVAAENSDREKVYQAIAKQQGSTVEAVSIRRAFQIVKKAKPGEWLQDANGKWYSNPN